MGAFEALQAAMGEDFFKPTATVENRRNWQELCVCGHLSKYHAPAVGGSYVLPGITEQGNRRTGETFKVVYAFDGCQGALPPRGLEPITVEADREKMVITHTYHCTCPCTEFRHVANVDRPNRFFNQRMPKPEQTAHDRHPAMLGMKAFHTHLTRRKAAQTDPDWATAEFNRRLIWIPEKQKCSISSCKVTGDDVFPTYVNDDRHSEMRCGKHR